MNIPRRAHALVVCLSLILGLLPAMSAQDGADRAAGRITSETRKLKVPGLGKIDAEFGHFTVPEVTSGVAESSSWPSSG